MNLKRWRVLGLICLGLAAAATVRADEVRVAVAANFATTLTTLAHRFERDSGHRVILSSGSTGKHYAQIVQAAPFDLFFAADVERPRRLEAAGLIVPGSRVTYARGRLALFSRDPDRVDDQGRVLREGDYTRLAIANPRLAPYGLAAQQALTALGLWPAVQDRLVRGENIGQTYQFVHTGAADLGFVALSQVSRPGRPVAGSMWVPPADLYEPIEQQAVLLTDKPAARALLDYVRSPAGRAIIEQYGYGLPEAAAQP